MAGKVIRLHGSGEEPGATISFDIAIVPAHVHDQSATCPYCDVKNEDYVVDYIEIQKSNKSVDIIQCAECEEVYLVVNQPLLLEADGPIITRWHMQDPTIQ